MKKNRKKLKIERERKRKIINVLKRKKAFYAGSPVDVGIIKILNYPENLDKIEYIKRKDLDELSINNTIFFLDTHISVFFGKTCIDSRNKDELITFRKKIRNYEKIYICLDEEYSAYKVIDGRVQYNFIQFYDEIKSMEESRKSYSLEENKEKLQELMQWCEEVNDTLGINILKKILNDEKIFNKIIFVGFATHLLHAISFFTPRNFCKVGIKFNTPNNEYRYFEPDECMGYINKILKSPNIYIHLYK